MDYVAPLMSITAMEGSCRRITNQHGEMVQQDYTTMARSQRDRVRALDQRKRTFNVARPKILRPSDLAPTMTTPVRVAASSDLIRPLNSMSQPSFDDTIAGADNRTA